MFKIRLFIRLNYTANIVFCNHRQ